jgi:uncharacterized protein
MSIALALLRFPLTKLVIAFLGTFAVLIPAVYWLMTPLAIPDTLVLYQIIAALASTAMLLFVSLVIERTDLRLSPFGGSQPLRELGLGALIGSGLISGSVAIVALLGGYRIDSVNPANVALSGVLSGAILHAGVSVFEENLFRGMLLRYGEELFGSWIALLGTAAFFGAAHLANPEATVWGAIAIALEAGILLGAGYLLTRNLWLVFGLHWAWNFMQGPVFGSNISGSGIDQQTVFNATAQGNELISGGRFGIEASIIAVVLCTSAGIAMLVLAVRRGQMRAPFWWPARFARS